MNITIVGGGNVGIQFAVHCAQKQHRVIIYTSRPRAFEKRLCIVDENNMVIHEGEIYIATNDEKTAFVDADIIFVTVPAYGMEKAANEILPYCNKDTKIGLIPGTGGGEWAFKGCLDKGAVIFGLQRVPSVARIVEQGKIVRAVGYRKVLHVAALPFHMTEEIRKNISDIFDMDCEALPNYLNLTLTPSNPILHTTRLKTLFRDYKKGIIYDSIPLFYEDWDDETSQLLFRCDDEVQSICRALQEVDLSYVKSLKKHYESDTPTAFTRKIAGIRGFKGLKTPMIEMGGGYIPDLESRYFTADFSYGLEIFSGIAELLDIEVPNMDEILQWYSEIALWNDKFSFKDYGVTSKKQLLELYIVGIS